MFAAGGSDTHFGSAAIQEFLDNLKASAPTFETPKQQLEEIQASATTQREACAYGDEKFLHA